MDSEASYNIHSTSSPIPIPSLISSNTPLSKEDKLVLLQKLRERMGRLNGHLENAKGHLANLESL